VRNYTTFTHARYEVTSNPQTRKEPKWRGVYYEDSSQHVQYYATEAEAKTEIELEACRTLAHIMLRNSAYWTVTEIKDSPD